MTRSTLSSTASLQAGIVLARTINLLALGLALTLCLWMATGLVSLMIDLINNAYHNWEHTAEQVVVRSLMVLALLEIIRTLQSYIKLGRVRVTFILDTALVVLISELMGLWFKNYQPEKVLLSLWVIATLVVLRIVTSRFSPESAEI
ncbi:MAG: hypothetical protein BMS9Abin36_0479 [Gammaproteobacteria bacterium]|nr:MAG: hypothetical protein BMS9Abin36_0479 [Gammaproteobacteria bacterium]